MSDSNVQVRLRLLGAAAFSRDAKQASRDITGVGSSTRKASTHMLAATGSTSKLSSGLGSMAARAGAVGALAGGVFGLARAVRLSASEYTEAARVGAQTDAVIKSTGGSARVTADHVEGLANSISLVAGIDDETIQSAENMMLTFKNVRNEVGKGNQVFDLATQASTDMAVAMGIAPRRAALQLGKALNDPVKGITALTRVGVTFSANQKKMIGSLVASGDRLAAQKLILRELNSEFGGSAAAQAQPIDKMKVAFQNLAESAGRLAAPVVNRGFDRVAKFLNQVQSGKGAVGGLTASVSKFARGAVAGARGKVAPGGKAGNLGADVGRVAGNIGRGALKAGRQLLDAFAPAMPFFKNVLLPLLKGVAKGIAGSVVVAFKVLVPVIKVAASALGWIGKICAPLKGVFEGVGMVIGFIAAGPILKLLGAVPKLGVVFRVLAVPVRATIGIFKGVVGIVGKVWGVFGRALMGAQRFVGTFTGMPARVIRAALNMVSGIMGKIEALPGRMLAGGKSAIKGLLSGIRSVGGDVLTAAKGLGSKIIDGMVGVIKKSPGAIKDALMSIVPGPVKGAVSKVLGSVPGLATGGHVTGTGWAMVGERGPELLRLPGGSTVYDHQQTAAATSQPVRGAVMALTIPLTATLDGRVVHQSVVRHERLAAEAA